MKVEIVRLNLLASLRYVRETYSDPFSFREGDGEKIFCFELDESQTVEFDPDKTAFFASPLFCGKAANSAEASAETGAEALVELPQGNYLFAQKREITGREDIAGMALEVQQEALWQRLLPGSRLYLRYLFEDGSCVSQIFRPFTER